MAGPEPSTQYEASVPPAETAVPGRPAEAFPTCPSCFAPLGKWLRTAGIYAGDEHAITIAYCGRCGVAIGTVA